MSHSLRCRLKDLRYKKIITDRELERLCKALDTEKAIDDIRAEIKSEAEMFKLIDRQMANCFDRTLQIIDKHTKENEVNE